MVTQTYSRATRLAWILRQLQDGPKLVKEFDLPISLGRFLSDTRLLGRLGLVEIKFGRTDYTNLLTLVQFPTKEALNELYFHSRRN